MKYRTTQKEVKSFYANTIKVGYCNLQFMLQFATPEAYTARREGWAADIYGFGNTAIVTGYAPFGNVVPPYELIRKYEQQAEKIIASGANYHEKEGKINGLIKQFIQEAIA